MFYPAAVHKRPFRPQALLPVPAADADGAQQATLVHGLRLARVEAYLSMRSITSLGGGGGLDAGEGRFLRALARGTVVDYDAGPPCIGGRTQQPRHVVRARMDHEA